MTDISRQMSEAYEVLLGLVTRMVESLNGTPIAPGDEWRYNSQTLAVKMIRHLVSMRTLFDGSHVVIAPGKAFAQVDHGSITVLNRAALETYLVWYYLYGHSNKDLGEFRYRTWVLGGLMDRQRLKPSSQEYITVQANDLLQIEALRTQISSSIFMESFTSRQKVRLLDGDWKAAMGTADLAVGAGFHGVYFSNVYNYLCSYAHASYASAMQVGTAVAIEDQMNLARSMMHIGVVTMAHFACSYARAFTQARIVLDSAPNVKVLAERYALRTEDMEKSYAAYAAPKAE